MTPRFHPREDHWLDYGSGQMAGPVRSLMEAHLAFCGTCRRTAGRDLAPGGALLQALPQAPAPDGLLGGILARLGEPGPPRVGSEVLPIPRPLWCLLPPLEGLAWRGALTRGFRFLPVAPDLFLIHMERGRAFPEHGHAGFERSVILAGGLEDAGTVLEAGDFDEADGSRVHSPVALADEDCWILASLDGGIRFTGWRGLAQRLAGR